MKQATAASSSKSCFSLLVSLGGITILSFTYSSPRAPCLLFSAWPRNLSLLPLLCAGRNRQSSELACSARVCVLTFALDAGLFTHMLRHLPIAFLALGILRFGFLVWILGYMSRTRVRAAFGLARREAAAA